MTKILIDTCFVVSTSAVFTRRGAPLDDESFAERAAMLSSEELLALVRDPTAHGLRVTWRHSTSEMWSLLAEYTQSHDTLDPLLQIRPDDLQNRQVWRAIEAMVEIAGDDPTRWNKVLDWIRGVITELCPPTNYGRLGACWRALEHRSPSS